MSDGQGAVPSAGSAPGGMAGGGSLAADPPKRLPPFPPLHAGVLHDWSAGTSEGKHTIHLDALDESITRLVCCRSLAGGSSEAEGLEGSDLWFSLTVDSDMLAGARGLGPSTPSLGEGGGMLGCVLHLAGCGCDSGACLPPAQVARSRTRSTTGAS